MHPSVQPHLTNLYLKISVTFRTKILLTYIFKYFDVLKIQTEKRGNS